MEWSFLFFFNSILLGAGLAMDAFSVSLARGLVEPRMKKSRMCLIAGTFAAFQFAMPVIGWICIHTIANYFKSFERLIPWIALALLGYIGSKMIIEGIRSNAEQKKSRQNDEHVRHFDGQPDERQTAGKIPTGSTDGCPSTGAEKAAASDSSSASAAETASAAKKFGIGALLVQGVATSIDALSVGFTIAEYGAAMAVVCSLIIAAVTFAICLSGILIGRAVGTKLSGKADILGGAILLFIGIEIFVKGVFFSG